VQGTGEAKEPVIHEEDQSHRRGDRNHRRGRTAGHRRGREQEPSLRQEPSSRRRGKTYLSPRSRVLERAQFLVDIFGRLILSTKKHLSTKKYLVDKELFGRQRCHMRLAHRYTHHRPRRRRGMNAGEWAKDDVESQTRPKDDVESFVSQIF
jgi:hypothetical protein